MSVSLVARKHGVGASQLFNWRKLEREATLTAVTAGGSVVSASKMAAARAQIAQLQRVLGKKTTEAQILKGLSSLLGEEVDCALALVGQGRAMKAVCLALGVARSHVSLMAALPPRRNRTTDTRIFNPFLEWIFFLR